MLFTLCTLSTSHPCAGFICVALGTGFLALVAVLLFALRNVIGSWFVDDPAVQRAVASIAPIAAAYQLPDGILGAAGGGCLLCHNRHSVQGMHVLLSMLRNLIGSWFVDASPMQRAVASILRPSCAHRGLPAAGWHPGRGWWCAVTCTACMACTAHSMCYGWCCACGGSATAAVWDLGRHRGSGHVPVS